MRGVGGSLVWEVTRPIVNEVAAPAEALQVLQPIVAQIVTEAGWTCFGKVESSQ